MNGGGLSLLSLCSFEEFRPLSFHCCSLEMESAVASLRRRESWWSGENLLDQDGCLNNLSLTISAHSTKSIPSSKPTHNPKAHQIVGVLSAVRRDV